MYCIGSGWLAGELWKGSHGDAPALFLRCEAELPVWDTGGVQAVAAPEKPPSTAPLVAG